MLSNSSHLETKGKKADVPIPIRASSSCITRASSDAERRWDEEDSKSPLLSRSGGKPSRFINPGDSEVCRGLHRLFVSALIGARCYAKWTRDEKGSAVEKGTRETKSSPSYRLNEIAYFSVIVVSVVAMRSEKCVTYHRFTILT